MSCTYLKRTRAFLISFIFFGATSCTLDARLKKASVEIGSQTPNLADWTGPKCKVTFTYTGSMQSFAVPNNITILFVKAWGAGGGMGSRSDILGGGGAFVQDKVVVSPGESIDVLVGGGGESGVYIGSPSGGLGGFGGGGNSGTLSSLDIAGGGGGRSALRRAGEDIVTAGGGGGSQYNSFYGGGGGLPAGDGTLDGNTPEQCSGKGATSTAGGTGGITTSGNSGSAGAKYQGGNGGGGFSWPGAGGGGGYYGGGGGCSNDWLNGGAGAIAGAGGGGSSFGSATAVHEAGSTYGTAGGSLDSDYNNYGKGATCYDVYCKGGDGAVVIEYPQLDSSISCPP